MCLPAESTDWFLLLLSLAVWDFIDERNPHSFQGLILVCGPYWAFSSETDFTHSEQHTTHTHTDRGRVSMQLHSQLDWDHLKTFWSPVNFEMNQSHIFSTVHSMGWDITLHCRRFYGFGLTCHCSLHFIINVQVQRLKTITLRNSSLTFLPSSPLIAWSDAWTFKR